MSAISNTILAFSMSADAFAASVSKGTRYEKPSLSQALRIGAIFGSVETITPIIGWMLGLAASGLIQSIDHWIAFTILAAVGTKMIYEGFSPAHEEKPRGHRLSMLVLTAIGTSIDAMAVGVTLALLEANIWMMALMIGFATFVMSTIGIMTGHYIGEKAGKIAEIGGGICLIVIGSHILYEHLYVL